MKGIIFKEEMFKAVLDGRKTQTRRILKIPSILKVYTPNGIPSIKKAIRFNDFISNKSSAKVTYEHISRYKFEIENRVTDINARYNVGETVYMKEPYIDDLNMDILYKFNAEHAKIVEEECAGIKNPYKNKLFMPESAARYFIKITDVRVEQLQDISEEDAKAEGVSMPHNPHASDYSYRTEFMMLWDSINKKIPWEANPYVFVYEFELIK